MDSYGDIRMDDSSIEKGTESEILTSAGSSISKFANIIEVERQQGAPPQYSKQQPSSASAPNLQLEPRFSCCPVVSPNAPIEDPQCPAQTPATPESRLATSFHGTLTSIGPTFTSLKKYGYVSKPTGPLVRLNISGTVFLVKVSTLRNDPLVFDKILEDAEYIPETDEYYFERDAVIFRFVLSYLRNKELHLPMNICGPLMEKELESWGLQLGFDLQRCCLGPVMETKSKMESLRKFEERFSEIPTECRYTSRYDKSC